MEQQLKQQLMQKKIYANLSQKRKRKYSFFHLTIRKNSTNYIKKPPSTIISKSRIHISK